MILTYEQYKASGSELPLVSIVAVCHNHAPYVVETLESIRLQTYANIELIIINNLKDECGGIINNWILNNKLQVRFKQNESILNISENVNLGVRFSSGKYFQIISCDDIILSTKIESQVKVFETLVDDCACVFGRYQKVDRNGKNLSATKAYEGYSDRYFLPEEMRKILAKGSFIALQTALVKRDAFLESGGVNPKYAIEDYYLWILLVSRGYSFYLKNDIVTKYRILSSSLWNSRGLMLIEHFLLIRLEFLRFLYFDNRDGFNELFKSITQYIRYGGKFSVIRFLEIMNIVNIYSIKYHSIIWIYNFIQMKLPRYLAQYIFLFINKYLRAQYLIRVVYRKFFVYQK
jgi:glycosyltransferase involved in cell wall biosynthesis